jgi:transposase
MARLLLTDDEWDLIADVFPEPAAMGRPPRDKRQVVNGILWILRTGAPWRDLPEEFGPCKTVWRLFDQWNADGTLDKVLRRLQAAFVDIGEIDQELWCIDGTIIRAARCAAGGGKKRTRRSRLIMR